MVQMKGRSRKVVMRRNQPVKRAPEGLNNPAERKHLRHRMTSENRIIGNERKKSENKIEKNRGILLIFCTKVYII
jgi:hypothetical protein